MAARGWLLCVGWRGEKDAGKYKDVAGFCKSATTAEIAAHIDPKIYPQVVIKAVGGIPCIHVSFSGNEAPYFAHGRAYMRVNGLRRVDVPEIAPEALREAIINAFCHRDWRDPESVRVAISLPGSNAPPPLPKRSPRRVR